MPASIPTLTVSASIKEASLLLTHLPSNTAQKGSSILSACNALFLVVYTENDYLAFQGFKVCDDVSLHKLELAKLVLTNLSSKFALQAGEETTAEVLGHVIIMLMHSATCIGWLLSNCAIHRPAGLDLGYRFVTDRTGSLLPGKDHVCQVNL